MRLIGGPYRCDEKGEITGPYTLDVPMVPPPQRPLKKVYRAVSIVMTLMLWVIVAAIGVSKTIERRQLAKEAAAAKQEYDQEAAEIQRALQNAETIPLTHTVGAAQAFGIAPEQAATGWWYSTDPSRVSIGPGGEIRPVYDGKAIVCVQKAFMDPHQRQCWRVEAKVAKGCHDSMGRVLLDGKVYYPGQKDPSIPACK